MDSFNQNFGSHYGSVGFLQPIAKALTETVGAGKPNIAKGYWVDKAIDEAAFILERIDKKWPSDLPRVSGAV